MSNSLTHRIAAGIAILGLTLPQPAFAEEVDFGDDTSDYSKDGECDDLRFEGPGMTDTILLEEDVGHDATDCRVAYDQGRLTLASPVKAVEGVAMPIESVNFGDDSSDYASDGECDDVRFVGSGMAVALMTDSIGKDASDCKAAYQDGELSFNPLFAAPTINYGYGDNAGLFPNDGECDDIRFTGEYSSEVIYLAENIGHDANDCRAAMETGEARWQGNDINPNFGMEG